MRNSTARMSALSVAMLVITVTSCTDETAGPGPEIRLPEPEIVGAEEVPAPADEIYYMIHPVDGPEPALVALLADGVAPVNAWYPTDGSPCGAPTATEALVVELVGADGRMAELGFLDEPGPWLVNCGIDSLWEYAFEE